MNYLYKKYIESIIYDKNILNKPIKIKPLFLENLKTYIDTYNETMDKTIKIRIYNLLSCLRENEEYDKNLINEIIIKLNKNDNSKILSFYYDQATIRAHDSEQTSIDEKMERLQYMHEGICKSISYDYEVIEVLSLPPTQFEEILPKYISDGWFLCSIKGIYAENSGFFDNKEVITNLTKVIEANEKTKHTSIKNLNKQIKVKILKR